MFKFTHIIILTLVATLIVACSNRSANSDRLNLAETVIWSNPDSALLIIESIVPDSLSKGEERSRYALLRTMAMDKAHLAPTEDSAIAAAVDFFKSSGDVGRHIIASFYHGRVLQHNGRYPQALLTFYQTKELAEKTDSAFWAGMACRDIATVYHVTHNKTEELDFAQREYELIRKADRQPYLNYALYDVGIALESNGDFQKAIGIAEQLIDSAVTTQDPCLYYGALQIKSYALIDSKNYSAALPILSEICHSEFAESTDTLNLCLALARKGREEETFALLDKTSEANPGMKSVIKQVIYENRGEFEKTLKERKLASQAADSILWEAMHRNLAGTLSDYLEMRDRIFSADLTAARMRTSAIFVSSIILMTVMTFIVVHLYKRQRREIDQKVMFADQIRQQLDESTGELHTATRRLTISEQDLKDTRQSLQRAGAELNETRDELKKTRKSLQRTGTELSETRDELEEVRQNLQRTGAELGKTRDELEETRQALQRTHIENKKAFDIITFLQSTKYELLEELADIVRYNENSKTARRKIAETVTCLIDDLSGHTKRIEELERGVDKLYDNLFSNFRVDFPDLKDIDYRLFLFSILRISGDTICLLLKEQNIGAVYNRKRRLKDKIKKLNPAKTEIYLKYL